MSRAAREFGTEITYTEAYRVTSEQIRRLWNGLDKLEDCPIQGYELEEWRLWMKILIAFMLGVGPRSNELVGLDTTDQVVLGNNPHIVFPERKNLDRVDDPVFVPIMIEPRLFEAYFNYQEENDERGKLIPSPESKSGSRTPDTLNNWIRRLCEICDVRLPNGEYPTLKNFRKTWKTEYKKAVHENRDQIRIVSMEDGKKSPKSDEKDYIPDREQIQDIRELGRKHFNDLLKIDELPELLQETEANKDITLHSQSRLQDYS